MKNTPILTHYWSNPLHEITAYQDDSTVKHVLDSWYDQEVKDYNIWKEKYPVKDIFFNDEYLKKMTGAI